MGKTVYVHSGSKNIHYNISKILFNKPIGGLWASRYTDKPFGYTSWLDWIVSEDYKTEYYADESNQHFFTLKDDARILLMDGTDYELSTDCYRESVVSKVIRDIISDKNAIDKENPLFLDYSYIIKNYDAMELIHGRVYGALHFHSFNIWDADSIVIWNENVVEWL